MFLTRLFRIKEHKSPVHALIFGYIRILSQDNDKFETQISTLIFNFCYSEDDDSAIEYCKLSNLGPICNSFLFVDCPSNYFQCIDCKIKFPDCPTHPHSICKECRQNVCPICTVKRNKFHMYNKQIQSRDNTNSNFAIPCTICYFFTINQCTFDDTVYANDTIQPHNIPFATSISLTNYY